MARDRLDPVGKASVVFWSVVGLLVGAYCVWSLVGQIRAAIAGDPVDLADAALAGMALVVAGAYAFLFLTRPGFADGRSPWWLLVLQTVYFSLQAYHDGDVMGASAMLALAALALLALTGWDWLRIRNGRRQPAEPTHSRE